MSREEAQKFLTKHPAVREYLDLLAKHNLFDKISDCLCYMDDSLRVPNLSEIAKGAGY